MADLIVGLCWILSKNCDFIGSERHRLEVVAIFGILWM